MIYKAFGQLVPSYISPTEFWSLSFSEIDLLVKNIKQRAWDKDCATLKANRILAADISKVLAGKSFEPIESYLPPNPRSQEIATDEELERRLLIWAKED